MPCEALVVGNLELVAISGLHMTWGSLEASPWGTSAPPITVDIIMPVVGANNGGKHLISSSIGQWAQFSVWIP